MRNTLLGLLTALFLVSCSSTEQTTQNVEPKITVGSSLNELTFNDQFEKQHTIENGTNKVIFAFSKDMAHLCNDYFNTKEATYLTDHKTQFVADVSAAPSLIRSMFIMPGLKDFKHTVLLLDSKEQALPYKTGLDSEKIIVAYVENGNITSIKTIATKDELISVIENS